MKKHTRFGLMFVVMLILTLALTIPGLADEPTLGDCVMSYAAAASTAKGSGYTTVALPGQLTDVGWYDGTLINICEGVVPFGELAFGQGQVTFYTYDELRTLDFIVWTAKSAFASVDTYGGTVRVWDLDGTEYTSTYWEATIYPEGRFVVYKEYTP